VPAFLTLLVAAALGLPAVASAGTYVVEGCTPGNTPGEQVVRRLNLNFTGALFPCGNIFDGAIRVVALANDGAGGPLLGSGGWEIEAPPNTTIQEVTFERSFEFEGPSNGMVWRVSRVGGSVIESVGAGTTPPPNGVVTFPVNSERVTGGLVCPVQAGCRGDTGSRTLVRSKNFFVRIADTINPTISVEPPSPTTPLHGTVEIPYEAEDVGSGVSAVFLVLDFVRDKSGEIIGESRDDNGGKCRQPFKDLVPCKPQVSRSISFDTTRVSDGPHTISLAVADSSSNIVFTTALPVLVDNSPPTTSPGEGGGSVPPIGPPRPGSRPETKIAKHPRKRTSSRKARFSFRSDQPTARFECKLDRRRFKSCRSPYGAKVKRGRHSFQVRAVDGAGSADPTPAVFRWRVS